MWLLAAGCWLLAAVAGLLAQYSVLQTVALRHPGDAGGKRAVTRSVSRWFGITAVSSARGRRSRLLDGRRSRLLDGQWKRRAALTSVSSRRPPVEGLDGRWKGGGRGVFPRPHPVGVAVLAPPLAAGATPVCLDARGGGLPELWLATFGAPPGGVRPTALMADHRLPVCDGRLGDGLPVCDGRLPAVVGDGRRRAREQRGEGAHGPRYGRKVVNGRETTAVGEAGQRQAKRSYGSGVGVGVTVVAVVVVVGVVVVVDGVGVGGLLLQLSFLWPMLAVDRTDTHTPTQRHRHRNIHTYTHIWPLASSLRKAPFNNGTRSSTMGNEPK